MLTNPYSRPTVEVCRGRVAAGCCLMAAECPTNGHLGQQKATRCIKKHCLRQSHLVGHHPIIIDLHAAQLLASTCQTPLITLFAQSHPSHRTTKHAFFQPCGSASPGTKRNVLRRAQSQSNRPFFSPLPSLILDKHEPMYAHLSEQPAVSKSCLLLARQNSSASTASYDESI